MNKQFCVQQKVSEKLQQLTPIAFLIEHISDRRNKAKSQGSRQLGFNKRIPLLPLKCGNR